ncbi:MAG: hypothetical protein KME16_04370 [Scytolyngbya sp. HA4215-MV1]|nr:hypothetical protein [Scytolyngbya sp. HA4215-MV1]
MQFQAKQTRWMMGAIVSLCAFIAIPVHAAEGNQSDTSGTNVFNDTTNSEVNCLNFSTPDQRRTSGNACQGGGSGQRHEMAAAAQTLQTAISELLNNEAIGADTKGSLQRANACLGASFSQCSRKFDREIRRVAKSLQQDINTTNQACAGGDAAACTQLNRLVGQTNQFLTSLERFKTLFTQYARTSRTF